MKTENKEYDKDKKVNTEEQSGLALVMTLGVLSMLIVLALAFASSARTSSKIAQYDANTTRARLMAEGTIEKVIALANLYNANVAAGTTPPEGVFIDTSYGEKDNDYISNNLTSDPDVKWSYITATETYNAGALQEREVIIGRVAYIVTGNPTFIDPAACVEQGTGAQVEGDSDRPGRYVNEINLANLGAPIEGSVLTNISSQTAGGQLPDGGVTTTAPTPGNARWPALDTLCTNVGITINPQLGSDYDKCSKWFKFPADEDKEAFYTSDPKILYKRFNLRNFQDANNNDEFDAGEADWWDDPDGAGDTDGNGTEGNEHVAFLLNDTTNLVAIDPATPNETECIPYLASLFNYGDGNGIEHGTFADCKTLAEQITANLIDYSDTDDVPTSDVDPATWSDSAPYVPTYTGNEKTPYINELSAQVSGSIIATKNVASDGTVTYEYIYGIDLRLGCELINIYDIEDIDKASIKVTIYGDYRAHSFLGTPGNSNPQQFPYATSKFTESITLDSSNLTADNKYVMKWSLPVKTYSTTRTTTDSNPDLKATLETRLNIQKVVLEYNSKKVDYAVVENRAYGDSYGDLSHDGQSDANIWVSLTGPPKTEKGTLWYKWQVKDPRENLNDEDWEDAVKQDGTTQHYSSVFYVENDSTTTYHGTWGKTNCDPSSIDYDGDGNTEDQDIETTTDQADVSTAYIRNAPMESPWELGAIHRGIAGQTINFNKVHSGYDMRNYTDGDANILDQIKMFSNDEVFGKFNINCGDQNAENEKEQKECLAALFAGIHLGADYEDPVATGTALSKADATDLAGDCIDDTSSGHGGWSRRSQVANLNCIKVGQTDAEREELIGKFINLCKAGTSDLGVGTKGNIIVLAQTIKDVGGGVTLSKDINEDGEIADFTDVDDVDEDGDTTETIHETATPTYGTYDQMFDEITSQTVLTGKIELDGNVWKLKSYYYPE